MAAAASDADRWVLLFAAVPPPPSRAAEAFAMIGVRPGGDDRLALQVTDPALRKLQSDIDALNAPESAASAAVVNERMRAIESDPALARQAREIDRVLKLENPGAAPPTTAEIRALERDVSRTLAEPATRNAPGVDAAPPSAIIAYRSERMMGNPRAGDYYKRLFEAQTRYAGLHAARDREALLRRAEVGSGAGAEAARAAIARELVEAHHALAQQQLADARGLFVEARTALRPVVEHMADLARVAQAQGRSAVELAAAYGFLKSHAELLLTIDRVALEDAGFWAGARLRAGSGPNEAPYEFAAAPNIDLGVGSGLPAAAAPYPPGRARNNEPPGIR